MTDKTHQELHVDSKDSEYKKLYLIHHMHHLNDNNEVLHELHHCSLYGKPDMKGEKHTIIHINTGNQLQHVIDNNFTGILYDHVNNRFNVINGIIAL